MKKRYIQKENIFHKKTINFFGKIIAEKLGKKRIYQ